jgi:LPS export ABC transporter protein LptC
VIRLSVWVCLLGLLGGCVIRRPQAPPRPKNDLTFNTVNLQQTDEKGRPLWRLDTPKVTYQRAQGEAEVDQPKGMLYREGRLVYTLSAQRAQVKGAGSQIFLEGNVVLREVTPQGGQAQVRAENVVWLPSLQSIQIPSQLKGSYKGGTLTAVGGTFSGKSQRLDLIGPIVGIWPQEQIEFQTKQLAWLFSTQTLVGSVPVKAVQQTPQGPRQAQGDRLYGDLKTRTLVLQGNAQLTSTKPAVVITAPQIAWSTATGYVTSNNPTQIQYLPEQLTLTAQQGVASLRQAVIQLTGQASAVAPQGHLRGDRLTWVQTTGYVEAVGNVVYEQRQPFSRTQGQQAVGNLLTRTVVVQGGRVSSLVIPEPRR